MKNIMNSLKQRIKKHNVPESLPEVPLPDTPLPDATFFEAQLPGEQLMVDLQDTLLRDLFPEVASGADNAQYMKQAGKAIYTTLMEQTTSSDSLSRLYDKLNAKEKLYYDSHVYDSPYFDDLQLPICSSARTKAAEELTGLNYRDLENAYPLEANDGTFEGNYNAPKYYEGLKFGTWETTGYVSTFEIGSYEIDKSNKDYQDYKIKHMQKTIEKICDRYPEYLYNNYKLTAGFTESIKSHLDNSPLQQHRKSAIDLMSEKNAKQPKIQPKQFGLDL